MLGAPSEESGVVLHAEPIGAFVGDSIPEGKEGEDEEGGISDGGGCKEGGIADATPPSTARPLSLPRRAALEGHNLQGTGDTAGGQGLMRLQTLEGVAPVERVPSERDAGENPHLSGSRPSSSLLHGRPLSARARALLPTGPTYTRNPKPETQKKRYPKSETRDPKPETRNPKPETRNSKSET